MWLETEDDRQLIKELSLQIVADVEPIELEIFDDLMDDYFADPTPVSLEEGEQDRPIGSGFGEVLIGVTPVVAALVSSVLTFVVTETVKVIQEESVAAIKKKIKGRFRKPEGRVPLTQDQLKQVRRLALNKAKEFGLEEAQAKQLADALIGRIALSKG